MPKCQGCCAVADHVAKLPTGSQIPQPVPIESGAPAVAHGHWKRLRACCAGKQYVSMVAPGCRRLPFCPAADATLLEGRAVDMPPDSSRPKFNATALPSGTNLVLALSQPSQAASPRKRSLSHLVADTRPQPPACHVPARATWDAVRAGAPVPISPPGK